MIVLGIETSCDETAVGIVDDTGRVLSNQVLSQIDEHRVFGGVVPEIAARAHLDYLDRLIVAALEEADLKFSDLDGIAATCGPGLIGGVMVGMMAGKAIAAAHSKPFIAVNHLEAHVLTARLCENVNTEFPFLVLLVSGGHTQILLAEGVGRYTQLGTTIDDALGECFDKSAMLMGLPYPGGPALEKIASECTDQEAARERFPLPKPLCNRPGYDFSFSGLKTAVRTHVDALPEGDLKRDDVSELCYSLQETICDVLKYKCDKAIHKFFEDHDGLEHKLVFAVVGGVAANKRIRQTLEDLTEHHDMAFAAPPMELCSDNGVMIAWTGIERLRKGMTDKLDVAARPRWPLDQKVINE